MNHSDKEIYDYGIAALYRWTFGIVFMCAFRYLFPLPEIARKRRFVCFAEAIEHGVAISMKAKEGITPQEVIDKYDGIIRKSFPDFRISFDNYSRTCKIHHDTASEFSQRCMKGDFIEQVTSFQLYDAKADQFLLIVLL
jgi:hypothetical protein